MCSSTMTSTFRNFRLPRPLVLFHDFSQIVDAIDDTHCRDRATSGATLRGTPKSISNSERLPRAAMARSSIARVITGSGLATEHTIMSGHSSAPFQRIPGDDFRTHAQSQFPRALGRAVGHAQRADPAIAQMRRRPARP